MDTFDRYIDQGKRAIRLHPDYEELDLMTCASDMIASILHAAEASLTPDDIAAGGTFSADGLLAKALRCYRGDFEDVA